ncbi:MAG: hypothetical protein KDK24_16395 [Pseudooceanicola sp.]|nr:hypothetical protein [Pseudooceanicola sp.]
MNALTLNRAPTPAAPAAARPVRVVICGERNAGKSTVLNLLARQMVVPAFGETGPHPVLHLRHGTPHVVVTGDNGTVALYDRLAACDNLDRARSCEVVLNAPALDGLELIELPLPEGGPVPAEARDILAGADLLVWTTIASQAWRFTERAMVAQLPRTLHQRATLVVTRADKIRTPQDQRRIHRRLVSETSDYFDHIAFLAAPGRMVREAGQSDDAFEVVGGEALIQAIRQFASELSPSPASVHVLYAAPESEAETTFEGPHADTLTELRDMAAGMNGLLSATICDAGNGSVIHTLFGRQAPATAHAPAPGDTITMIELDSDGRFLTLCRLDGGAHQLKLTCRSGRVSPSLARNAALRMAHLWDQRAG